YLDGGGLMAAAEHALSNTGLESFFAEAPDLMRAPYDNLVQYADELQCAKDMGENLYCPASSKIADKEVAADVNNLIHALNKTKRALWYGYKQHPALSRMLSQWAENEGLGNDVKDIESVNLKLESLVWRVANAKSRDDLAPCVEELYSLLGPDGLLTKACASAESDGIEMGIGFAQTMLEIVATSVVSGGVGAVVRVARVARAARLVKATEQAVQAAEMATGAEKALAVARAVKLAKTAKAAEKSVSAVTKAAQTAGAAQKLSKAAKAAKYITQKTEEAWQAFKMGFNMQFAHNALALESGELRQGSEKVLNWFKDAMATGVSTSFSTFAQASGSLGKHVLKRFADRYNPVRITSMIHMGTDSFMEIVEEMVDAYARQALDGDVNAMTENEFDDIWKLCLIGGGLKPGMVKAMIEGKNTDVRKGGGEVDGSVVGEAGSAVDGVVDDEGGLAGAVHELDGIKGLDQAFEGKKVYDGESGRAFMFKDGRWQEMQRYYHYTSADGAQKIVDERTIRASRASFSTRRKNSYFTDISPDRITTNFSDSLFFLRPLGAFAGMFYSRFVDVNPDQATHYIEIWALPGTLKSTLLDRFTRMREHVHVGDLSFDEGDFLIRPVQKVSEAQRHQAQAAPGVGLLGQALTIAAEYQTPLMAAGIVAGALAVAASALGVDGKQQSTSGGTGTEAPAGEQTAGGEAKQGLDPAGTSAGEVVATPSPETQDVTSAQQAVEGKTDRVNEETRATQPHVDAARVEAGRLRIKEALGDDYEEQVRIIEGWPRDVQLRFYHHQADFNPVPQGKPNRFKPGEIVFNDPKAEMKLEIEKVDEFNRSLTEEMSPDKPWRRIAATPQQAAEFHSTFKPTVSGEVVVSFENTEYVFDRGTLQKMERWAVDYSQGLNVESNGYFKVHREGDRVIVENFIPVASYSQSIDYPRKRLKNPKYGGDGQMSTAVLANRAQSVPRYFVDFDGVDPQFYTDSVYVKDRESVLHFHSHFTISKYQSTASPEDYVAAGNKPETRILWTPGTNLDGDGGQLILYQATKPANLAPSHAPDTAHKVDAYRLPSASFTPELNQVTTAAEYQTPLRVAGLVTGAHAVVASAMGVDGQQNVTEKGDAGDAVAAHPKAPAPFAQTDATVEGVKESNLEKTDRAADLSRRVFTGDQGAFRQLSKDVAEGHIADTAIIFEETVFSSVNPERQKGRDRVALDKLEALEKGFDVYVREHDAADSETKRAKVKEYLDASGGEGVTLDLKNEVILNATYQALVLHEYLIHDQGLLDDFAIGKYPSFLGDLLNGDFGQVPHIGSCGPIALLAVHLGRRMGLSIHFLDSSYHVSLRVDAGGTAFILDPTGGVNTVSANLRAKKGILKPLDFYVKAGHAATTEASADNDFVFGSAPQYRHARDSGTDIPVEEHEPLVRELELARTLAPRATGPKVALGSVYKQLGRWDDAERIFRELLEIFPNHLHANIQVADLLRKKGMLDESVTHIIAAVETREKRIIRSRQHSDTPGYAENIETELAEVSNRLAMALATNRAGAKRAADLLARVYPVATTPELILQTAGLYYAAGRLDLVYQHWNICHQYDGEAFNREIQALVDRMIDAGQRDEAIELVEGYQKFFATGEIPVPTNYGSLMPEPGESVIEFEGAGFDRAPGGQWRVRPLSGSYVEIFDLSLRRFIEVEEERVIVDGDLIRLNGDRIIMFQTRMI
ncbi:MAG: hypothetical protein HQM16_08585, partial [Deltaproteobacteria bacterium]|nr:hypothetical protein [Deltaproteobacteria bacterium]